MSYDFAKNILSIAHGPEETGVLVAYRPDFDVRRSVVTWFDPIHQRSFDVQEVTLDEPDELAFRDKRGRVFRLRPMTLDVYRKEVKPKLIDGRDFKTEEELRSFFGGPK